MDYLILGIAVCVIVLLITWIFNRSKKNKQTEKLIKNVVKTNVKCPICESYLNVGENLISKVYRPMDVPDQLMVIMGCPHCYPKCEENVKRVCPVCHKTIGLDQSLTARLFNKTAGKKHVHVMGCSNCHVPRAD